MRMHDKSYISCSSAWRIKCLSSNRYRIEPLSEALDMILQRAALARLKIKLVGTSQVCSNRVQGRGT